MSYSVPKRFVGQQVRVYLNCPMVIKEEIVFPSQAGVIKQVIPGAVIMVSNEDGEEFVMGMERVHRVALVKQPVKQLMQVVDDKTGAVIVPPHPVE